MIREKEADYILAVKENQPTLHRNIREIFEGMESGEIRGIPEDVAACMTGNSRWRKAMAGLKDVKRG
jgi:predicted transposase YbfD/YdcC